MKPSWLHILSYICLKAPAEAPEEEATEIILQASSTVLENSSSDCLALRPSVKA
eukprot:CAMPEP_0206595666 /NCGR_PEP_ID=MMETSP0325_2-20121206/43115_1 /ASSEMBLY_ACC=CAM_ASM_000347 /TAXON_ID=2866 /ORGANISM="Crypthecodinium cohnii, Strain Seligo" /LENGTH=53 /DNA_ID=CAMNT_0054106381 /DNA_START=61 /DNA_END=218 /DNA_ORIENTATION=-